MATTMRALALEQMREWAAQGKGEVPPGTNLGEFVAQVLGPAGLTPPQPYCASAISRAFQLAAKGLDKPMPFPYSPGALNLWRSLKGKGWSVDEEDIQPGDLVFWRRGPVNSGLGHVGIVEYGVNEGRMQTIEANHGSVVAHFHYDEGGWQNHFVGAARVPG